MAKQHSTIDITNQLHPPFYDILGETNSNAYARTKGKSRAEDTFIPVNTDSNEKFIGDKTIHQQRISDDTLLFIAPFYTLQYLPNEILTLILTHCAKKQKGILYQCALINKRFNTIVNGILWGKLNFDYIKIKSARFLTCLAHTTQKRRLTLGHSIRELRLNTPHWKDTQFLRLLPLVPHLKHLSLHASTRITSTSFQQLPYHCPQLTSLHLALLSMSSAANDHPHCPWQRLQQFASCLPLNENARNAIKVSFDCKWDSTMVGTSNDDTITTPTWPRLTTLTLGPCNDMADTPWVTLIKSAIQELVLVDPEQLVQVTMPTHSHTRLMDIPRVVTPVLMVDIDQDFLPPSFDPSSPYFF